MRPRILFLVFSLFLFAAAQAQTGSIKLSLFSGGYTFPLGVENCGDSRLFVVQKGGQISISDSNGTHITTPFLDISDRVDASGDETGLLGLAFSPKYASNGLFYVYYTNKAGNSNISQFKVSSNKNVANAASEKVVLTVTQNYKNHIGGCIKFGKDGFLYIGLGDGDGSAPGDPLNYAQNPGLLQGKMLRIKVNANGTYTIPPTNPFKDSANYRKETWAVGLRNPWRFSFDAANGNLWIGDVGEATWEEVDVHPFANKGGDNYGWHCYEGNAPYNTTGCLASSAYTFPKYVYNHSGGGAVTDCAITGGYVYRGKKYADLYGKYFFTDFCSGLIRSLTVRGNTITEKDELSSGIVYALTSFGEDAKNELYVVSSAGGQVYRILSASSVSAVAATEQPAASMVVYPNPSHGEFSIAYTAAKAESVLINVYGNGGRNIYSAARAAAPGENKWMVTLPNSERGNCYVTLTTASGDMIRRNIVVK